VNARFGPAEAGHYGRIARVSVRLKPDTTYASLEYASLEYASLEYASLEYVVSAFRRTRKSERRRA